MLRCFGVAEIDETRVDGQTLAVDDVGVRRRLDRWADGLDYAAAHDERARFEGRAGGGDDPRATNGIDVRRVRADDERRGGCRDRNREDDETFHGAPHGRFE